MNPKQALEQLSLISTKDMLNNELSKKVSEYRAKGKNIAISDNEMKKLLLISLMNRLEDQEQIEVAESLLDEYRSEVNA